MVECSVKERGALRKLVTACIADIDDTPVKWELDTPADNCAIKVTWF